MSNQHIGVYLSGSLPLMCIFCFGFVCVLYFMPNKFSLSLLYTRGKIER